MFWQFINTVLWISLILNWTVSLITEIMQLSAFILLLLLMSSEVSIFCLTVEKFCWPMCDYWQTKHVAYRITWLQLLTDSHALKGFQQLYNDWHTLWLQMTVAARLRSPLSLIMKGPVPHYTLSFLLLFRTAQFIAHKYRCITFVRPFLCERGELRSLLVCGNCRDKATWATWNYKIIKHLN